MGAFKYFDLGYTEVFIFDEFLINQIQEGVTITPEHNNTLVNVIEKYFKNKPFVYISNRINSYSVDPITYLGTSSIYNLLAIAIVAEKHLNKKNALYESNFFNKPFKVFDTLSKAMQWVQTIINENRD
ncbi:hypothetical protein [Patiriisocius hiemis]|uniref:STAS/SEC14 domain-containing protein n=1 Tax=Patiriisocius hiemis TaxID=3075604 RepID=A0ABU2YA94_9FLAO|nr:hypothetical protein [Constantimarinum sp. W242]MDT0554771.1 hypothetical protein [Constantimarinum sp. W242]